jgi:hypothetical protein
MIFRERGLLSYKAALFLYGIILVDSEGWVVSVAEIGGGSLSRVVVFSVCVSG